MEPSQTDDQSNNYNLSAHKGKVVQPLPGQLEDGSQNPAAELIRQKLGRIYKDEPSAKEEQAEAEVVKHRSRHQQFMHELSHSGKSLAEIQTEWHNYYVSLPDSEKHQVWQEFYATHSRIEQGEESKVKDAVADKPEAPPHREAPHHKPSPKAPDTRTAAEVKEQLLSNVKRRRKPKASDHVKSILFGLSMGAVTLFIVLFGFFNERFIAPFMTPSRSVSSAPIVIDPSTVAAGSDPRLIIPKINIDIPVVYDEASIDEKAVQKALERGALHYAITSNPGELGNGAIFGHSSNNILNQGSYKFAFVLLNRMQEGDTFFLQKEGKRFAYKVYKKHIVKPTQVDVLQQQEKVATFTLITCDPPGTNLNRLVVVGEQISPDPTLNVASSAQPNDEVVTDELPSNAPSLWSRFWTWVTG